jgi:signal transduction histidine kinase
LPRLTKTKLGNEILPGTSTSRSLRWRFTIAGRLYFVVGIMGLLIVLELLTLRFAMKNLSAVRAFVGGESLWSKAQKNSIFSLQRYAATRDDWDYQQYESFLTIPKGDHAARIELFKPHPDLEVVRRGFLQGKIHPDDIDPMVDLLVRFHWVKQLDRAIRAWTNADTHLEELIAAGSIYRDAVKAHDEKRASAVMNRVKQLNEELTELEEEFSSALGDGSRFLERVVLSLLTLAVIMVESIGLGLAILTARSVSAGLRSLNEAAGGIGRGEFEPRGLPESSDEIGDLAGAITNMGLLLKKTYGELEARVRERTIDLARLAQDNARLYDEASRALKRRDEFLSLASHELKTPVTSMLLQTQLMLQREKAHPDSPIQKFALFLERQLLRINGLVEEMLDTSRIDLSKLALRFEPVNLSELVLEAAQQFEHQFRQASATLELRVEPAITGRLDAHRLEQVLTNLLSNALKYAPGKPVELSLRKEGNQAVLAVRDHGPGIPAEDHERIFGRFERAVDPTRISGLGIGLFISRAIVTAHGGSLTVDDPADGGARFVATLPLGQQT